MGVHRRAGDRRSGQHLQRVPALVTHPHPLHHTPLHHQLFFALPLRYRGQEGVQGVVRRAFQRLPPLLIRHLPDPVFFEEGEPLRELVAAAERARVHQVEDFPGGLLPQRKVDDGAAHVIHRHYVHLFVQVRHLAQLDAAFDVPAGEVVQIGDTRPAVPRNGPRPVDADGESPRSRDLDQPLGDPLALRVAHGEVFVVSRLDLLAEQTFLGVPHGEDRDGGDVVQRLGPAPAGELEHLLRAEDVCPLQLGVGVAEVDEGPVVVDEIDLVRELLKPVGGEP